MNLAYLAFTDTGEKLAHDIAEVLGGTVSRSGKPYKLHEWTGHNFESADGLIFVGAAGIAVRAVAPYVTSKVNDPAVVVVDECGRFAVSLLSGHLGGANDLARAVEKAIGAQAVITTATDSHGLFAVDEWAKRQNAVILNPKKIKDISSAVLAHKPVSVFSKWEIYGDIPNGLILTDKNCDVSLDIYQNNIGCLNLVPEIVQLGIGCRKNTAAQQIEQCFDEFIEQSGLCEQAIKAAASIDLKKDEAGLIEFCRNHGWELCTFSAEQLKTAQGNFTASAFVSKITGVDNVCERSAVFASGGQLIHEKFAKNGVTIAAAQMPYAPDWRWTDE